MQAVSMVPACALQVLAKCYGGDVSRKKKLLQKQAKGKKRMKVGCCLCGFMQCQACR